MASTPFPELIALKQAGKELTDEQIGRFVEGVVSGEMAESQIGAMLMAIYFQGLSDQEVSVLTRDMKNSGSTLTWPAEWQGLVVDKHSTGGVGDKVSLVLAPALAALGLKVPMISGRGLAHTGGTLDKLEAMPGFRVGLSAEEMTDILKNVGCFIAGQTGDICPADKKTYAIRDVTSTVDHIGLITASIVSKKATENLSALVLDVKTGCGALMKDPARAEKLARSMVSCSSSLGTKTVALLTDMDSPIGHMVGNALEVAESIQCLQGSQERGPLDLLSLVLELGGHLLQTSGHSTTVDEGKSRLRDQITNGSALSKFCDMIKAQGVDATLADDLCNPEKDMWKIMTPSQNKTEFKCPNKGYVQRIDAMEVAMATHKLGGGRNKPSEPVNWAVGVQLLVDIGDQISEGQPWVRVHHDAPIPEAVIGHLTQALEISANPSGQSRLQRVIH